MKFLHRAPIFLDTETTGLNRFDEIIEISLVNHLGEVLFESLVHPTGTIPPDSTRINKITNDMVANAPTWKNIWQQVEPILLGKIVVIYNAEFDVRMMMQSHQHWQIPWKKTFTPVCLMKLYAAYVGDWNSQKNDFRFVSLEKAGQQCGIDIPNTHRATDDTRLSHALLNYLANLPLTT